MSKVLSVTDLRKSYGTTVAVDGISFEVGSNEIVGLLGPNGAGKTTTINMILGVLEPTSGSIRIEGVDLAAQRSRALEYTNFAAVYAPLPGNLTVQQNLRIFGMLYGVKDLSRRIEDLLQQFNLEGFRERQMRSFIVGRANPRVPRQGHAQPATASAAGRADCIARSRKGRGYSPADRGLRGAQHRWRIVDFAQYVRSPGSVPPRAVSLPRTDPA